MKAGDVIPLLKESYQEWSDDKASRLAAALSYYTAFSLAPLVVVVLGIVSYVYKTVYNTGDAQQQLLDQIGTLTGPQVAETISGILKSTSTPSGDIIATVIGIVTLLVGATGVFVQLQDSLNTIWEVKLDPSLGIMATIKQRVFSLAMILGVGFLLLVSLVLSAVLSTVVTFFSGVLPLPPFVLVGLNIVIAFLIITLLFAAIFKYVPDVKIEWSDVWVGAAFTSLLFSIGRVALAWYLGSGSVGSSYGAAASLVVLLAWVYYSSLILFFGAEFTQVYARKFGSKLEPEEGAVPLSEDERATQGMTRDSGSKPKGREAPQRQPAPRAAQKPPAGATSMGIAGFIAGVLAGRRSKSKK